MRWDKSIEDIMEELCDEAQVRNKLHRRCYEYYYSKNNRYQLPILVLSVLSGSGNFIAGQFKDIEQWLILGIGGISIFTSIISSISQYLKLAQLSEGHRIAYLQWAKFYAHLKFQLLQRKKYREPPADFIKSVLGEYDRLFEISPTIPQRFITKLARELGRNIDDPNFKIPYYMNGYNHIEAYQTPEESIELDVIDVVVESEPASIENNISL